MTYYPIGPTGRFVAAVPFAGVGVGVAVGAVRALAAGAIVGVLVLGLSFTFLFGAWVLFAFARVELDTTARTVTVVQVRWPLPDRRRTFPLAVVRGAVAAPRPGAREETHRRLALVVEGQQAPVPLLDWGPPGDRQRQDAAIAEIQAALRAVSVG